MPEDDAPAAVPLQPGQDMPREDAPAAPQAAPTTGPPLTTDAQAPLSSTEQAALEDEPLAPPERSPYGIVPPDDLVGLRAIRVQLADLPFPMTKGELLDRAGNWRVPVTGAHYHPLSQYLDALPDARYRSVDAVLKALGKARPEWRP